MEKILTVPASVPEATVYVTGNHHVSVPNIAVDGGILSISHLSRQGNALVEYTGAPLLRLYLNDEALSAKSAEYICDFIPNFHAEAGDVSVKWQIFAPEKIRGFVFRVSLKSARAQPAKIALCFTPTQLRQSIFRSRPLSAQSHFELDEWTGAAVASYTSGFGVTALAMSGEMGFAASAEEGLLEVVQTVELLPNATKTLEFFISLGAEADGASLANMDMRRRADTMFEKHTALLEKRHRSIPDSILEQRLNLNLNFCYYFSMGYPLDGNELMLMTSKSSRYYVSGAYWSRDSMLWAFPAILRVDENIALKMLLAAFTTYLKFGAHHALYLNGASLYPGFELDELVAPLIALRRYVNVTGSADVFSMPQIRQGVEFTLDELGRWYDLETGLYRTELNPSDDPVQAPCLIYNNVLVLEALRFCNGRFGDFETKVSELEKALNEHAIMDVEDVRIYAWAVGNGKTEVYDDPPGSLLIMPYYGWPNREDEVYKNTVEYFFSNANEYFSSSGALVGQGCEHAPSPWAMSICNLLLARAFDREKLLNSLRTMSMDNGLACETVYAETGVLNTGAAFATFAGFYANAIIEAYENED